MNTHKQKLMLSGNKIKTLPSELHNCKKLELIRLAANQMDNVPEFLLDMPRYVYADMYVCVRLCVCVCVCVY